MSVRAYWEYIVDENICNLSDEYYTMLGYEPGEFPGSFEKLFSLLHPDDIEHTTKKFEDLFLKKTTTYLNEVRLLNKAGEYIRVISEGYFERNDDGILTKFVGWNRLADS